MLMVSKRSGARLQGLLPERFDRRDLLWDRRRQDRRAARRDAHVILDADAAEASERVHALPN